MTGANMPRCLQRGALFDFRTAHNHQIETTMP